MVDHRCPYIFAKRGVYYFTRRIPRDLLGKYQTPRICMSMKTKSLRIARLRSASLATKLEEDWMTMRWSSKTDPFHRFLCDQATVATAESIYPTASEALALYLKAKSEGKSKTFTQSAERAIRYLSELHGDKPLDLYSRTEANQLRDAFLNRGLAPLSVKRVFRSITAIVNFSIRELGLDDIKAFSGIFFGNDLSESSRKRPTFPLSSLKDIQKQCRENNDQARWIIALLSDTGMRLSEALGLTIEDLHLNHKKPYLRLQEHAHRRLKTRASSRIVPLTGIALWAVEQAVASTNNGFLFPKYCSPDEVRSNSASATLNKWLSPRVPEGCVVHSFRHTMRDRLRAVECPTDIIDRIGGWSIDGVGESYGDGYPEEVLHKWMQKATAR